jgi:hypothetical protein
MPTNRKRKTRGLRKSLPPLDESIKKFLLSGFADRGSPGWDLKVLRHFDGGEEIKRVWEEYRSTILSEIEKGTRPWAEGYLQRLEPKKQK